MKLFQTIKSHLPVSSKAHQAAMAKAKQDQDWLLSQLRQTVRRNVELETKMVRHAEDQE